MAEGPALDPRPWRLGRGRRHGRSSTEPGGLHSTAQALLLVNVTCHLGAAFQARVPLFHDDSTAAAGSLAPDGENWGEVCRFYAPGSPEFQRLYAVRNDIESRHNDIKTRMKLLPRDRAGQELRLLGTSMLLNAVGWQVHLRAVGEPNVVDNTA